MSTTAPLSKTESELNLASKCYPGEPNRRIVNRDLIHRAWFDTLSTFLANPDQQHLKMKLSFTPENRKYTEAREEFTVTSKAAKLDISVTLPEKTPWIIDMKNVEDTTDPAKDKNKKKRRRRKRSSNSEGNSSESPLSEQSKKSGTKAVPKVTASKTNQVVPTNVPYGALGAPTRRASASAESFRATSARASSSEVSKRTVSSATGSSSFSDENSAIGLEKSKGDSTVHRRHAYRREIPTGEFYAVREECAALRLSQLAETAPIVRETREKSSKTAPIEQPLKTIQSVRYEEKSRLPEATSKPPTSKAPPTIEAPPTKSVPKSTVAVAPRPPTVLDKQPSYADVVRHDQREENTTVHSALRRELPTGEVYAVRVESAALRMSQLKVPAPTEKDESLVRSESEESGTNSLNSIKKKTEEKKKDDKLKVVDSNNGEDQENLDDKKHREKKNEVESVQMKDTMKTDISEEIVKKLEPETIGEKSEIISSKKDSSVRSPTKAASPPTSQESGVVVKKTRNRRDSGTNTFLGLHGSVDIREISEDTFEFNAQIGDHLV